MKVCFSMKSKKQQKNQNKSTLFREPQFKHNERNSSSFKESSAKIDRRSKVPNFFRRLFKRKPLPGPVEHNPQSTNVRSNLELTTNAEDDQDISLTPHQGASQCRTDLRLYYKAKLPPISKGSPAASLDHLTISNNSNNPLPEHYTPGVCGLTNIGNTCYMNSAIQCLSSIPDLSKWAMKQTPSLSHKNILDVYITLVKLMWSGRHECVTPNELKQYISRSFSMFMDHGQKDAHEFMNSLINSIEAVDSTSYLVELFRIHTQSIVTCHKCQQTDIADETTTFLPLPIPERQSYDHKSVLLENLVKDFSQEDELDGEYYCHHCKSDQPARQRTLIRKPLPRALIIQLKRFPYDGTSRKIDILVQYELEYQNLLSNDDRYELCAISMHTGNLSGGHYTAGCKNYRTQKWYRFDDSYFEEIDSKSFLSPFMARQAYILMNISEVSNKQELTLYCHGKSYNDTCSQVIINNDEKPYINIITSSCFYRWYNVDLRYLRLIMSNINKQSLAKSSKKEQTLSLDTNSTQPSNTSTTPIIPLFSNSLLRIFIRYLQLINFIPWIFPRPNADRPIEVPTERCATDIPSPTNSRKEKPKQMHKKTTITPGLCGLANIGNTCFMNSAIQCLSNIPQLTQWAKKYQTESCQQTVTQAYTSLIKSMWSGRSENVNPYDVKQRVSQYAPTFSDYAQKDSHEFMNSLFNAIHSELVENIAPEEQSSIITKLFHIQTESRVTCLTCSMNDSITEVTYCLPLPLGYESTVTLEMLLNDFLKEEQLDGAYYCSYCQSLQIAKQKTSLCQPLPPVIIVQLKRFPFDETDDKLNTLVKYPIENWNVDGNDNSLYDLAAVSMHVGTLKSGHYTTLARLIDSNEWYHFNDSHVRHADDLNILVNRDAYVLVYLKKLNRFK